MSTGAWVLVVAVVGALGFGLYRALTDGRFRGTHQVHGRRDAAGRRGAGGGVAAGRHPVGRRPRRAGDAAAVLLGVLRPVPRDAPCPRRRRRRPRRASCTSRSTPSTTSTSYAASGSCGPPRRSSSATQGAEVTRATGAPTKQQVLAPSARPCARPDRRQRAGPEQSGRRPRSSLAERVEPAYVDHVPGLRGDEGVQRDLGDVGRLQQRVGLLVAEGRVRIGVPVRSGLMQFTLMPASLHSSARAWVRLTTAAFAEE